MRKPFSNIIEKISVDDKIIFLTGDLGFNAFENIQISMKDRFINMGVAEQNMIGVAAGLAYKGYNVFCYSIAPFITYRCLEQIRLDICLHKLPVYIVGNGGGYGYGIMGATHHALEDIAAMSSLPGMECYIPAFTEDVESSVLEIIERKKPAYLRLGLGIKKPDNSIKADSINSIILSPNPEVTVIAMGPVIHNTIAALNDNSIRNRIDLFSALKIPFKSINDEFLQSIRNTKKIVVIEEHVKRGGLAEYLLLQLSELQLLPEKTVSLHAVGYPEGLYGSQKYHQQQSGLDEINIRKTIQSLIG